jgi:hypothetical protein
MFKTTLEELKIKFEEFKNEHGHYPNGSEISKSPIFPINVRTIDRNWGGLKNLRQLLGIEITDQRKGQMRSDSIKKILENNYYDSCKMYNLLVSLFGLPFVHQESPCAPGSTTRTDYRVFYENNKTFAVDIFNAKDKESLNGCANWKIKKYEKLENMTEKVYLVSMNNELTDEILQNYINKRKKSIPICIRLISLDKFTEILDQYKPNVLQ